MIASGRSAPGQSEPRRPLTLLDLGLRGPTLGVIQRLGILSVAQLTQMAPEDLTGMRRVGPARMMEIRQALQVHGLDLRTDTPAPPVRAWQFYRRVRLTCCDTGDCVLDLRTGGASAADVGAVVASFVTAHRACTRLGGREPAVSTVETSRPGASSFDLPSRGADAAAEQVRKPRSA